MPDLRSVEAGAAPYRGLNEQAVLLSEVKLPEADRFREWKRDPAYLRTQTEQQLYFAASPSPTSGPERWSLARALAPLDQPLQAAPRYEALLSGRAGFWDGGDLLSPTVVPSFQGAGGGVAVWYAANGDPLRPDYVAQIGLATSADGKVWSRRASPVLPAPAFTGPGADAEPLEMGPTSHGLFDPAVLPQGGSTVWLYFAGLSCGPAPAGCKFQILRAISTDGVGFRPPEVVLRGRDGVPEEAGGVAGPSVLFKDGTYYLAYTQVKDPPERSRLGVRRALLTGSLGLATSSDGVSFEVVSGQKPLLQLNRGFFAGGSTGPSLYEDVGGLHLFFGALSDLADPNFTIGRADITR